MDILAWSDSAKRDVESRGWIKEDSNRQSADTIREEGGVVVRKGQPQSAAMYLIC